MDNQSTNNLPEENFSQDANQTKETKGNPEKAEMNGSANKEEEIDQKSDEVKEADDEYSDDEMTVSNEESSEEEDDDDDDLYPPYSIIIDFFFIYSFSSLIFLIRSSNKECPVCGSDCPNQHATLEDGNYDKIIAAFFPQ
ncbi:hypothetical protein CTI12_AA259180 [Artemisia annua]|uniref:Uncharacterized protein n=1 Tax=Artemisia annua TaxID=35608 RepID=A0A2U1NKP9_ARTAN|nr:hypothetical protein CTI12_AA259180 [Artemisia annua]